jgi:hypothetical protein
MLDSKSGRAAKKGTKEPIPGASPENSAMSPDWAFVVQLREPSELSLGWFAGRVEHMMSGQSTAFATPQELVEFFRRVMNQKMSPSQGKAKRRK